MDDLIPLPLTSEAALASRQVRAYRQASMSRETKRAIEKGWRGFSEWCGNLGAQAYPCDPGTLEAYLIHLAESGRKTATIEQARYAINARHKLAGLPAPGDSVQVKTTLAGIRRTLGTRQRRSAALTLDHLKQIEFTAAPKGKRDRALLMVAVCGGFRRSELCALRLEDVEDTPHGVRLFLERSKSDQEGAGVFVDIVRAVAPEHCPVLALEDWLAVYPRRRGALFPALRKGGRPVERALSAESINRLAKWAAEACGLDPALYSGHSLRAGCATYLLDRGVTLNVVANHLRHKSINTTRRYDRNATARALSGVY